ncbi:nuclease-related domain-containing protein [Arthrobacter sp. NPDC058127]|uniref:nuclease-related domain-containing protein n=1 Tax=Arthrobacter sp. NPDC058127 TaxID=3346351 RepID=UPI0036E4A801
MRSEPASQDFPLRPGGNLERGGLSDRIPGQSVIEKLLADRAGASSRSFLGRIFGADPLTPDNHPWYKGALGEVAVGRILERLGPEWTVLHAVPVGAGTSDIDHVLIGPSGVFTLNTKNHTGQSVWVALVAAAAFRAGTWHRSPPAGADAASLQHEFAALRTLVDRARLRRAGWMLALSILALVVLANLTRFF